MDTNNPPSGINLFYPLLIILLGTATSASFYFFAPTDTAPMTQEPTLVTQTTPLPTSFSTATAAEFAHESTTTTVAMQSLPTSVPEETPLMAAPAPEQTIKKDRLSPSTPDGLTARLISENKVILSWSPSTDNEGVAGYRVLRNSVAIGTTIKTIYSFIHLDPATKYTFGIVAYDAAGNVSKTQNILITTLKKAVQPTPTTTPATSVVEQTPVTPITPAPLTETVTSVCGNGIQDRGEECDDGNTNNNDSCTNQCKMAYCGDMVINYQSEQCDDGNQYDNDYCTNACQNHTPVVPDTTTTTAPTSTSGGTTAPSNTNTTTFTVHVNSSGACDVTSLTLHTGDSVNFLYSAPIGDEVKIRFSPTTISAITLDHEHTQVSRTWNTSGTWIWDTSTSQGTIVVQ